MFDFSFYIKTIDITATVTVIAYANQIITLDQATLLLTHNN